MNTVTMTGCELDKIVKAMHAFSDGIPLIDVPRVVDRDHVIYLQIEHTDKRSVFDSKKDDILYLDLGKLAKIDLKQYDTCEILRNNTGGITIKQRVGDVVKGVYKSAAYIPSETLPTRKTYLSTTLHEYYTVELEKSKLYKITAAMKKMSSDGCNIRFNMDDGSNVLDISYKEQGISYRVSIDCDKKSKYGFKSIVNADYLLRVLKITDRRIRLGFKTDYPLRIEWTCGNYKFAALIAPRIEPDD